jgi:cytochrome c-type biogenesis protein CcmH
VGRPSQAEAEEREAATRAVAPPAPPDVQATIDRLRDGARNGTAGAEELDFLAFIEERTGNLSAAVAAQRQLLDLRGAEATAAERARLLDLMVGAAGGLVTPEAEEVLGSLRDEDPQMSAVLYYSGASAGHDGTA